MSKQYWNLLNDDLLLEFVKWVRQTYPLAFRTLIDEFIQRKETEE